MAGNTPNISQDTFDISKEYDKVDLQQGVPIVDSDWNELQDIIRMGVMKRLMLTLGNCRLPPGSSTPKAGFQVVADGSSNDFEITGGYACIDGVLVPSEHGVNVPTDIQYDSDDNYMMEGTVSNVASGNIEDEDTEFFTHMDVVNCRVKMTSGTEIGNTFTVSTRVNATTLTLSGGTGSISTGDTYLLKPPALTTPTGIRTDEVYIHAWYDDINSNEDTDLLNPSLLVEPSHRKKLRACIRVAENSTTPSTPDEYSFGARYLKIATLTRAASASISPSMVSVEANAVSAKSRSATGEDGDSVVLVWRSEGWPEDSGVSGGTVSIYATPEGLCILTGTYIQGDEHVIRGTEAGYGTIVLLGATSYIGVHGLASASEDLGDYNNFSGTWTNNKVQFHQGWISFSGKRILFNDGVDLVGTTLDVDEDSYLNMPNNDSVIAHKFFEVPAGYYPQIYYTNQQIWWLINTNYSDTTQEFVSVTPSISSFMIRFVEGRLDFLTHAYSATSWSISEWTDLSRHTSEYVASIDVKLTRAASSYSLYEARSFAYQPGLILVRVEHSTEGDKVGLFRIEGTSSGYGVVTALISGDATYFSITPDNSGTVNVYPYSGSTFRIENNLEDALDIRYSVISLEDL